MADETGAAPEGADAEVTPDAAAQDAAAPKDAGENPEQATDAAQAADADKPEGEDAAEKDAAEPAEFALTVPEGADQFKGDIEAFQSDMGQWIKDNPDASAADALQEAVNRQSRIVAESMQAQTEAVEQAFTKQIDDWTASAKADPEFGGSEFDANVGRAVKALDAFGTPELREALDASGLGSHPEMIRFILKASKAVEDAGVVTGSNADSGKSLAERVYGKT